MAKVNVKKAGTDAVTMLVAFVAFLLGAAAVNKVKGINRFAPGAVAAAGLIWAQMTSTQRYKIAAYALTIPAVVNIVKTITDGKTGILSTINSTVPTLSGTRLGRLGSPQPFGYLGNASPAAEMLSLGNDSETQYDAASALSLN
jgi:hypothetical protein